MRELIVFEAVWKLLRISFRGFWAVELYVVRDIRRKLNDKVSSTVGGRITLRGSSLAAFRGLWFK